MLFEIYINRIAQLAARGKHVDAIVFGNLALSVCAGFFLMGFMVQAGEPYRTIGTVLASGVWGGTLLSFFLFWLLLIPLAIVLLFFSYGPSLTRIDSALVRSWLLAPVALVPFVVAWSFLFMITNVRDPGLITLPPGGPAWIHWQLIDVGLVMTPVLGLTVMIQTARIVNHRITEIVNQAEPCCSHCGYSLTGLPKPLCPECGQEHPGPDPNKQVPTLDSK